jgi:hypothetical protein
LLNIISGTLSTGAPPVSPTSYESIATYTVGSGGSSGISFTSIPSTFKHLQIRCMVKNSTFASMYMEINGDTGANYSFHRMYGDGSSVVASGGGGYSFALCGITGTQFGSTVIDILDYTNTNKNTTVKSLSGYDDNGSGYVGLWSGAWYNTNAVSSINLVASTFQQYSQIALYGIKGS